MKPCKIINKEFYIQLLSKKFKTIQTLQIKRFSLKLSTFVEKFPNNLREKEKDNNSIIPHHDHHQY